MGEPPVRYLAIDPGSKHVGWAVFREGEVIHSGTDTPDQFIGWFEPVIGYAPFGVVVVESFQLKSDSTDSAARFTVELIGVIRYLCKRYGVPLVEQSPSIKRPTFGRMQLQGIECQGKTRHARDAEVHAYAYWSRHLAPATPRSVDSETTPTEGKKP
jgi:hypothetical protein